MAKISLKDRIRSHKDQNLSGTLPQLKYVDGETLRQRSDRVRALKALARSAQDRERDRWSCANTAAERLTMLETETAAKLLADNPDVSLLQILQCVGVPGPNYGQDVLVPLAGRMRAEIETRARRFRTSAQALSPTEIQQVSVDYLISVIDNDSIDHKLRLKAVETLAKLAAASRDNAADEHDAPVTVPELIAAIRVNVLGVEKGS